VAAGPAGRTQDGGVPGGRPWLLCPPADPRTAECREAVRGCWARREAG